MKIETATPVQDPEKSEPSYDMQLSGKSFPALSRERLTEALPHFSVDLKVSAHTDSWGGGTYTKSTLRG
jgi:hypothetical protein